VAEVDVRSAHAVNLRSPGGGLGQGKGGRLTSVGETGPSEAPTQGHLLIGQGATGQAGPGRQMKVEARISFNEAQTSGHTEQQPEARSTEVPSSGARCITEGSGSRDEAGDVVGTNVHEAHYLVGMEESFKAAH
jgi:hypothetical protein